MVLLALPLSLEAQRSGRATTVPDVWPLNEAEQVEFWETFRSLRPAGQYALEFDLRHLPRRGRGPSFRGQLWGALTPEGPVTRILLMPGEEGQDPVEYLILGGHDPMLWKWTADEGVTEMPLSDSLQPLIPGVLYSPFDISMPFLFWEDYNYKGSERLRGRGAHIFELTPPNDTGGNEFADIGSVEVAVDAQFNAMLRATIKDKNGKELRSFSMLNFRRTDDQWIVRTIDLLDETTRDRTRFDVRAAALNLSFPPETFHLDHLGESKPVIDDSKFDRF